MRALKLCIAISLGLICIQDAFALTYDDAYSNIAVIETARFDAKECQRYVSDSEVKGDKWLRTVEPIHKRSVETLYVSAAQKGLQGDQKSEFVRRTIASIQMRVKRETLLSEKLCVNLEVLFRGYESFLKE